MCLYKKHDTHYGVHMLHCSFIFMQKLQSSFKSPNSCSINIEFAYRIYRNTFVPRANSKCAISKLRTQLIVVMLSTAAIAKENIYKVHTHSYQHGNIDFCNAAQSWDMIYVRTIWLAISLHTSTCITCLPFSS